jgi:hypothetical protein
VRLHLKDVKKGWFNLEETSNEVYRFSKLRAFLQYLNFLMQDTLQFMVADSLRDYARFLKRACLHQVCNRCCSVTIAANCRLAVSFMVHHYMKQL